MERRFVIAATESRDLSSWLILSTGCDGGRAGQVDTVESA